jgi:cytochrome c oxidase subunit 1
MENINVHGTYFVICAFSFGYGDICVVQGMFAGNIPLVHVCLGGMLNKILGYIHFWVTAYIMVV